MGGYYMVLNEQKKPDELQEEIQKEKYEPLVCEIIHFSARDIIVTSGLTNMGLLGEIGEDGNGNEENFLG